MSLQYIHNRADLGEAVLSATIAFSAPTREFLDTMFKTHSSHALFTVGISIMSNKDVFVKSIGRENAIKRLASVKFQLVEIQQDGTTHIYRFFTNEIVHNKVKYYLNIRLTTVAESNNVRLIDAFIEEAIRC